ncbi:hypothetical protein FHS83_003438 [Rhizomicrobium palustre]|uniref:Uncharacterized protein n=1 Tax=Rhizomicrobium palustre TaxID=189966 RepID=A0A846N517_9PROT|nr:hypothetical protein [Rhizomicrobium palustre]NIK90120.1 hypothetical protein [Rhizomicrobium palustre]
MRRTDDDETIKKRSGWVIPLAVFLVTFLLSAGFLLFYLAPSGPALFDKQVNPTARSEMVTLRLAGRTFYIPANYLLYAGTRQGGDRKDIAIFALLPNLTGWSNWDAEAFASNSADSKVVYLTIKADKLGLSEEQKLARVYKDYLEPGSGHPGPAGLTQYSFREDTGYRSEDLYVGQGAKGPIVMRCVKPLREVPNPSCLRETVLFPGISLSYRFKRTHLGDWQEIAAKVDRLITSFEKSR